MDLQEHICLSISADKEIQQMVQTKLSHLPHTIAMVQDVHVTLDGIHDEVGERLLMLLS